jgi:hypothetical protein
MFRLSRIRHQASTHLKSSLTIAFNYLPDDGYLKAETCSKVLFEITNVFH